MVEAYCTPIPDLEPLFWLAVLLSFVAVSFFYSLGRFIGRREFEAIARKELNEVIIAVAISLAIVGFAGLTCETAKTLIQEISPEHNQFTYSYEYLNKLIVEGRNTVVELWGITFPLRAAKFDLKVGVIKFNPTDLFQPWIEVINRFAGLLFSPMVGSLQLQLLFLQLSQAFAMTVILPMGMILRAMPMTRKGGSFMLALAFALYIVLPLMYAVNYNATKYVWDDLIERMENQRNEVEIAPFAVMKRAVGWIFAPFEKMALIFPQAIPLAVINITITLGFVNVFANFLDQLK